eukprot:jgi/Hompol1/1194/HPOL_002662-RA
MLEWRNRERLKTVSVSIVLCLNIGVDPPDVVKPVPCARMECWVDPFSMPSQRSLETIGGNLQTQYQNWQPRARYRLSLDPSIEETKKLCISLRRNAKDERILFHYNGHGVPRPTPGGEIWVFNKNYTQYIPVSVYDIQTWLGSPCIFVYDCSNAGNILLAFDKFATQRDWEMMRQHPELVRDPTAQHTASASAATTQPGVAPAAGAAPAPASTTPSNPALSGSNPDLPNGNIDPNHQSVPTAIPTYIPLRECIQLAACQPHETLPTSPDLPADLFTCCLTTPIEIALRWFVLQSDLKNKITTTMLMKIPGKLTDRRTPFGELNWIFTAITDTIAWNVLPSAMFQKLFRQDLMVAALFRNFLLADRIMRHYNCHPMSSPALPETHRHPMWDAWDLAADQCLRQLPALLETENTPPQPSQPAVPGMPGAPTDPAEHAAQIDQFGISLNKKYEYQYSTFFTEQLSAFEIWLRKGGISRKPPQQLPIVLQVLLSQVHRVRALMLLSKFLDLGQWAVALALSVGIFPYILRLLQSPASELKPVLVFIWAKILAVDSMFQNDLIKDNGYTYFINILSSEVNTMPAIPNLSEHRAMCAFILSVFCHNFRHGQQACLRADLLQALVRHLDDKDPLLRQWTCVCLAELWKDYADAKWIATTRNVHDQLIVLLHDGMPEVRAAAIAALGGLFGDLEKTPQIVQLEQKLATVMLGCHSDPSPLVRLELTVALSRFADQNSSKLVLAAMDLFEDERKRGTHANGRTGARSSNSARRPMSMVENASGSSGSLFFEKNGGLSSTGDSPKGSSHASLYSITFKALLNLSVDPARNVAWVASQVVDKIHFKLLTSPNLDPSTLQLLLAPNTPSVASGPFASLGYNPAATDTSVTGGTSSSNLLSHESPAVDASNPLESNSIASTATLPLPSAAIHGPLIPASARKSLKSNGAQQTLNSDQSGVSGNSNMHHQRQHALNRPRPVSASGHPSQPVVPTIKRSTSLVASLRSLAGLMVGSYGTAHQGTPTKSGHAQQRQTILQPKPLHSQPAESQLLSQPSQQQQQQQQQQQSQSIFNSLQSGPDSNHNGTLPSVMNGPLSELLDPVRMMSDSLALESGFYKWSCEYFAEPQMKVPEAEDPGSVKFIELQWRRDRNRRIIEKTDAIYPFTRMMTLAFS